MAAFFVLFLVRSILVMEQMEQMEHFVNQQVKN
jgi:hypothetical protein